MYEQDMALEEYDFETCSYTPKQKIIEFRSSEPEPETTGVFRPGWQAHRVNEGDAQQA
jgi:hypothetical protein